MMYHTDAIVLKKEEWNEADLLVTVLSEDFGKIRLLAQGARKHGAKLQGHLEPGSRSDLSFVIGRNGSRLTTARLGNFFLPIRQSFMKLQALQTILLLLDGNLLEERDRASELFRLVRLTFEALGAARDHAANRITAWFTIRFLDHLGFLLPPDAPEAKFIPSLLELKPRPLEEIMAIGGDEGKFDPEFRWLGGYLRGSVILPQPVKSLDFEL